MKQFLALMLIGMLLLTACSAPGTSSATSPIPETSSKSEASSQTVSTVAASSAEPIIYMGYDEYFSEVREIEDYEYFQKDENGYYMDGNQYVMPIPPYSAYALRRLSAQTKTGVLLAYEGDVYLITKSGEKGQIVYSGEENGFRPEQILAKADEHIFFVVNRNQQNPSEFQVCRIFRPTGQSDIIATNEQIKGEYNDAWVWGNHLLVVESVVPSNNYEHRSVFINTLTGECIQSDDPKFKDAVAKWE